MDTTPADDRAKSAPSLGSAGERHFVDGFIYLDEAAALLGIKPASILVYISHAPSKAWQVGATQTVNSREHIFKQAELREFQIQRRGKNKVIPSAELNLKLGTVADWLVRYRKEKRQEKQAQIVVPM